MVNRSSTQVNRNQDYIVGTITVVDPATGKILVQDRFGTDYQISVHLRDPLFSLPQVGEGWLIRRTGLDWFLDKRVDTGNEPTALADMTAGDKRLEYNNLYLDGQTVVLSSGTLNSLQQQLAPPDIDQKITTSNVSSPPSSPANGDIWIATGISSTNRWQFQYNASSNLSSKWEFIGGATIWIADGTGSGGGNWTQTTINTWEEFDTGAGNYPGSCRFTYPIAGDYLINWSIFCVFPGAGAGTAIALDGIFGTVANGFFRQTSNSALYSSVLSGSSIRTVTAGQITTFICQTNITATIWQYPTMTITPIRVG